MDLEKGKYIVNLVFDDFEVITSFVELCPFRQNVICGWPPEIENEMDVHLYLIMIKIKHGFLINTVASCKWMVQIRMIIMILYRLKKLSIK